MRRAVADWRTLPVALVVCAWGLLAGAKPQEPAAQTNAGESAWTLGIYTGPSPFQLSQPANVKNPVLTGADVTDLKVDTLAHPFMVIEGSRYYLFFTAKDHKTDKGGIGVAESADGLKWKFRRTVIHESFVTSHPYVFKWENQYYMIPEAHTEKSVRLYRATAFPDKWEYERDLLTGDRHYISPTVVRYHDMWWMFVAPSGNDTVQLFYASGLKGHWTEHPLSPIVKNDPHTARPAGRPFVIDGALYRLGMDCEPAYGNQVRAFRITDIGTRTYAEKMIEAPLVKASSQGWNAEAMHHVDAHRIGKDKWIAAVDALGR